MNILIVSYESWRDTNNGGNVLSNIFCAFPDADIAQIYCYGETPQNTVCRKYFQISDSMLLKKQKGYRLEEKDYSVDAVDQTEVVETKVKNRTPSAVKELLLLTRELLWMIAPWKTEELEHFVNDFKPDIIFAPCYSYFHVSRLALHVKKIAQCPMVSYISDDNYSLKQFRLSPSFWINRLITRKWIRKLFGESSLVYTMTEQQKKEYENLLKRPMKVLCKSAIFEEQEKEITVPFQLIYAGGLYLNRWRVLGRMTEALSILNKAKIKAQLHIYSGSKLSRRIEKKLNDGRNAFLHPAIPYEELMRQYKKSDVAVHVESFDLKNRLITRLSFSTKIIDCMSSGGAILAIGPKTQAGISYLKENDAAICVDDKKKIYSALNELVDHPEIIRVYSKKSIELGKKNHVKTNIEKMVRKDFYEIVANGV